MASQSVPDDGVILAEAIADPCQGPALGVQPNGFLNLLS